jgi:hypothetical protein
MNMNDGMKEGERKEMIKENEMLHLALEKLDKSMTGILQSKAMEKLMNEEDSTSEKESEESGPPRKR